MQFEKIGSGKFWCGAINLEPTELFSHHGNVCFSFDSEADLIYLAVHDGGDLSGLDSRYCLGNHSAEYFCVCCQGNDKNQLPAQDTYYRTSYNINRNAELYQYANNINPNSKPSPLQMSKGVKDYPADPYPEPSRITPSSLHIDMGVMTHVLDMHDECANRGGEMVQIQTQKALDDSKIFKNRYHHNLEGNQAKLYRQQFSAIASVISSTSFYVCMSGLMNKYNEFMSIVGSSKPWIEESDCERARQILLDIDNRWSYMRRVIDYASSLGAKYHYLGHCLDYVILWRMGLGFINEQSIEHFHKVCSGVFRRYINQRGILRTKYAMHQIMLITSPLYQI